jgi:hypothetical protein
LTWPISASSIASTICICDRFSAIWNNTGRLQAGGDRLAGLDRAREYHAIHRRADHGALQVQPRGLRRRRLLGDLCLRRIDLRACLVARGAGEVGIAACDQLLLGERGLACVIGLGIAQRRLRAGQVRTRARDRGRAFVDLCFVSGRIDPRQHLAFVDVVVEVGQHFGDQSGDLRTDVHRRNRTQGTGGDMTTRISPRSTGAVL